MLVPRLLRTHTLDVVTKATSGGYDDYGNWVEGVDNPPQSIKGNLQPFKTGKAQQDLPEGVTAKDAFTFYSVVDIPVSDEYKNTQAATTVIDGVPFEFYDKAPWTGYGSRTEHYKYILIREDKMNAS